MVRGYKPEEIILVTKFLFFVGVWEGGVGGFVGEGIYILNLSFKKCNKLNPIDLRLTN